MQLFVKFLSTNPYKLAEVVENDEGRTTRQIESFSVKEVLGVNRKLYNSDFKEFIVTLTQTFLKSKVYQVYKRYLLKLENFQGVVCDGGGYTYYGKSHEIIQTYLKYLKLTGNSKSNANIELNIQGTSLSTFVCYCEVLNGVFIMENTKTEYGVTEVNYLKNITCQFGDIYIENGDSNLIPSTAKLLHLKQFIEDYLIHYVPIGDMEMLLYSIEIDPPTYEEETTANKTNIDESQVIEVQDFSFNDHNNQSLVKILNKFQKDVDLSHISYISDTSRADDELLRDIQTMTMVNSDTAQFKVQFSSNRLQIQSTSQNEIESSYEFEAEELVNEDYVSVDNIGLETASFPLIALKFEIIVKPRCNLIQNIKTPRLATGTPKNVSFLTPETTIKTKPKRQSELELEEETTNEPPLQNFVDDLYSLIEDRPTAPKIQPNSYIRKKLYKPKSLANLSVKPPQEPRPEEMHVRSSIKSPLMMKAKSEKTLTADTLQKYREVVNEAYNDSMNKLGNYADDHHRIEKLEDLFNSQ